MAARAGSSFTPGSVPSGVAIRGTGISRGSELAGALPLAAGVRASVGPPARPAAAIAATSRSRVRMVRFIMDWLPGSIWWLGCRQVAARCPRRTLE